MGFLNDHCIFTVKYCHEEGFDNVGNHLGIYDRDKNNKLQHFLWKRIYRYEYIKRKGYNNKSGIGGFFTVLKSFFNSFFKVNKPEC